MVVVLVPALVLVLLIVLLLVVLSACTSTTSSSTSSTSSSTSSGTSSSTGSNTSSSTSSSTRSTSSASSSGSSSSSSGFMAPEVAVGAAHSYPSDVFSWAATMFAMLLHNWSSETRLRRSDFNRELTFTVARFNNRTINRLHCNEFLKPVLNIEGETALHLMQFSFRTLKTKLLRHF